MQRALWIALAALVAPMAAADILDDTPAGPTADAVTQPLRTDETQAIWDLLDPADDEPEATPVEPPAKEDPSFADRVASALQHDVMMWGAGSAALVIMSLGGFAMVTRYVSPKEALKNPQRSMLYGFIRGNPGVHLKQLSEEFAMKTSSILWHIRKLESAELVKSERVGGFRVFYAVEGGIEIRRISRAITALQNDNARHIYGHIKAQSGPTARQISEALHIHGGTTRWHLRKLREAGLLDELVQEAGSRFFNTPLGDKALLSMEGAPTLTPTAKTSAVPE